MVSSGKEGERKKGKEMRSLPSLTNKGGRRNVPENRGKGETLSFTMKEGTKTSVFLLLLTATRVRRKRKEISNCEKGGGANSFTKSERKKRNEWEERGRRGSRVNFCT